MYPRTLAKPLKALAKQYKELRYFEKLAVDRVSDSYLVYAGDQEQTIGNIHVRNFKGLCKKNSPF